MQLSVERTSGMNVAKEKDGPPLGTGCDSVVSECLWQVVQSRADFCSLLAAPMDKTTRLFGPLSTSNQLGVGLTETLLKFSHQQHLRIAIEYIDRASMDQPIDVDLRNKNGPAGNRFYSAQWARIQLACAEWNPRSH